MLTRIFLIAAASFLMAGTPTLPRPCDTATGQCCCTLPSGVRCCGTAGNCAGGAIPGCDCAKPLDLG